MGKKKIYLTHTHTAVELNGYQTSILAQKHRPLHFEGGKLVKYICPFDSAFWIRTVTEMWGIKISVSGNNYVIFDFGYVSGCGKSDRVAWW
jgi:hypothetical protein